MNKNFLPGLEHTEVFSKFLKRFPHAQKLKANNETRFYLSLYEFFKNQSNHYDLNQKQLAHIEKLYTEEYGWVYQEGNKGRKFQKRSNIKFIDNFTDDCFTVEPCKAVHDAILFHILMLDFKYFGQNIAHYSNFTQLIQGTKKMELDEIIQFTDEMNDLYQTSKKRKIFQSTYNKKLHNVLRKYFKKKAFLYQLAKRLLTRHDALSFLVDKGVKLFGQLNLRECITQIESIDTILHDTYFDLIIKLQSGITFIFCVGAYNRKDLYKKSYQFEVKLKKIDIPKYAYSFCDLLLIQNEKEYHDNFKAVVRFYQMMKRKYMGNCKVTPINKIQFLNI
jgi:hypothetical protein